MNRAHDQSTLIPGIAAAVRDQIVLGHLTPGAVIHQTELAKTLGVSPVPLREALRRLESEGLVTFLPYRGTIVTPITVSEIREAYAGALALADLMLPEALPRLRAEDFATLRELAIKMDHGQVNLDESLQFYMLLLRPAGMTILLEIVRSLILRATRIFAVAHANRLALRDVRPTRQELVSAMELGDVAHAVDLFRRYHLIRMEGLLKAFAERS